MTKATKPPAQYVIELRDVGLPPRKQGNRPPGWPLRAYRDRARLLIQRDQHRLAERHERHEHHEHQQPTGHQPAPGPGLVNLSVRRGELITLTGPAGSGKSALLHVVGLIDRPTAGSYVLNGRDTTRLGDRDRAALRGHQIGIAFQRPHLLPGRTTLENVALPLRYAGLPGEQRTQAALAALDRVGLADRAQVMTTELSCAERKLVAIARALAASPGLVLFDDPFTGLDEAAAARIVRLLISLHREGCTVFLASEFMATGFIATELIASDLMVTADQVTRAYSSQRITLTRRP